MVTLNVSTVSPNYESEGKFHDTQLKSKSKVIFTSTTS